MSRLPAVKREDLTSDHQQIWDRIHAKRSGGGGPYSMLMHSPAMADHLAATEDYFRDHSLLADADREIIILTAAREVDARYAWSRHEIRAHNVGIRPEVIEALRTKPPSTNSPAKSDCWSSSPARCCTNIRCRMSYSRGWRANSAGPSLSKL